MREGPVNVIITTTSPNLTHGDVDVEACVNELAAQGHEECVSLKEALARFDEPRREPPAVPFAIAAAALSLWVVALPLAFIADMVDAGIPRVALICLTLGALTFSVALGLRGLKDTHVETHPPRE